MTDRGRPSTAAALAAAVVFPLRSVGKIVSLRSLRERRLFPPDLGKMDRDGRAVSAAVFICRRLHKKKAAAVTPAAAFSSIVLVEVFPICPCVCFSFSDWEIKVFYGIFECGIIIVSLFFFVIFVEESCLTPFF